MKPFLITSPEARAELIEKLEKRLGDLQKIPVDETKYINESRKNQMNALRVMIAHLKNKKIRATFTKKEI